jgi:hypothetical protein
MLACSARKDTRLDMNVQVPDLAVSGAATLDMSVQVPDLANMSLDLLPAFTISGTITGLLGYGFTLQDNGSDSILVAPGSSTFVFSTKITSGSSYRVTIKDAPNHPSQTCMVSNGNGVATADVGNVAITCTMDPADWLQFNFDAQHSGWSAQETMITPANVKNLKAPLTVALSKTAVKQIADGAPVYLRNVNTSSGMHDLIFVNTKDADLIALDAVTLTERWRKSHPHAGGCTASNGKPCYTTSSPAIDPNRMFVYSYGLDGAVHKHNVTDGTEITTGGWPETTTIKPNEEKGSSALTIAVTANGAYLYAAHGGYPGDAGDYQGHVTTINLATGTQHVFNTNCSNKPDIHFADNSAPDCANATQSAVWARAGVVYSAALDRIFFSTGNGPFDANLLDMSQRYDWGDTVLAIHSDGTGTATGPLDSYTPDEYVTLNNDDADLGSTAPALLPTPPGSKYAHLAVQSQKRPSTGPAQIRLINLDDLSGKGGPGNVGGELQKIDVPQGGKVLTAVAVWINPADGKVWFFITDDGGISGIRIDVAADGTPSFSTTARWMNGVNSTSPIVVNNMVFVATNDGIQALDPTTGHALWSGILGGLHWESPIVVNGQVYISDENGNISRFAL